MSYVLLMLVCLGGECRYVDRPEFHGLTRDGCLAMRAWQGPFYGGVRLECVLEKE